MQISDEMIRVAHAEYHKVLGDKNRSDPMRAALTAALSLSGWRTIDSAPKDGTEIILGWTNAESHEGYWFDGNGNHSKEAGWRFIDDHKLTSRARHPTHWQPLPAPPATAGKEG